MSLYKILSYPHVLLRKKSTPVEQFTKDLPEFVKGLTETMYAFDGIGLAAPQVGILKRILVVDVNPYLKREDFKPWHGKTEVTIDGKVAELKFPLVLVNPVISKQDEEVIFPYDGCLSFPGVTSGDSKRFKKIELQAKTEDGKELVISTEGILSICLQHEIDHLEGVLFIDRLQESRSDNYILSEIEDFENDGASRKKLKKMHLQDARKMNFSFLEN